ncbi:MAG TPA: tRNA uridine-5-carboxymethylaminomethyl(34) synthesis GTPase MnmE [bacterium]
MINGLEDTIAAIATPPGRGGIAIIRLSGSEAIAITKMFFNCGIKLEEIEPRQAVFGKLVDENGFGIDEAIAIFYKAPNSYTKENLVEINCHGGIYLSQKVLELAIQKGARLAKPGEFTLRAFLNGRIDLSQAEAVADLIQARTGASARASYVQLDGKLSKKINEISSLLFDYCSLLELELDFSEENVQFVERVDFNKKIAAVKQELEKLIETFQVGRIAREGVKLVITGKPNVGKSSLLNALIMEERAIVTDIPGTTRDALEVQLDIQGFLFRIIDTAGIKETDDKIEREGIRRAKKHLESADVILHVFDGSLPIENDDEVIMDQISKISDAKIIRIINKNDLVQKIELKDIEQRDTPVVSISALQNRGIEILERELHNLVLNFDENISGNEVMVTNVRHWEILGRARESLKSALKEAESDVSSEFISLYLRDALDYLGQITGKVTSDDILNNIFSKFCIGK